MYQAEDISPYLIYTHISMAHLHTHINMSL